MSRPTGNVQISGPEPTRRFILSSWFGQCAFTSLPARPRSTTQLRQRVSLHEHISLTKHVSMFYSAHHAQVSRYVIAWCWQITCREYLPDQHLVHQARCDSGPVHVVFQVWFMPHSFASLRVGR